MGRREGTGTEREGTKPEASHFNPAPGGRMPGKHDHRGRCGPADGRGQRVGMPEPLRGSGMGGARGAGEEAGGGEEREARRRKRPAHAAAAVGLDPVCTVVPDGVFS